MQVSPGTIVCGVDGSPESTRALTWAARQAAAEHRALTLVVAVRGVTPAYIDAAIVDVHEARRSLEREGREILGASRLAAQLTVPDLEVHEVLDLADPRSLLLQMSEHAAMVVVGSRGLGTVRSLLLGSVSVALVRHAHCPVVVVRPDQEDGERAGIVVGLDPAPESRPVLEFAYREASLHSLALTVVHCQWDVLTGSRSKLLNPGEGGGDPELDRLELAEFVAGMGEKYPDVRVATRVGRGHPQQVLTTLSKEMDLVVVGAHQHNRLAQAAFGSVSVSVVEHASCPVAVVPVAVVPVAVVPVNREARS